MLYRARIYPVDEIFEADNFRTLYYAVYRRFTMFAKDYHFAHLESTKDGRRICTVFVVDSEKYRYIFVTMSIHCMLLVRVISFRLVDSDTTDQLYTWAKDNGYDEEGKGYN